MHFGEQVHKARRSMSDLKYICQEMGTLEQGKAFQNKGFTYHSEQERKSKLLSQECNALQQQTPYWLWKTYINDV